MSETGRREEVPLACCDLRKRYRLGDGSELEVLRGVNFTLSRGEAVAVVGTSGSGKSTLLHLLGALDLPTSGEVFLDGRDVSRLPSDALARVRNESVGFVFQFHHLLREFSARENVMLPQLIAGRGNREAEARADELLGAVGLARRLDHRPWQLSGGEQQRVAVARAMANDPAVLLADEPTGNLDGRTSEELHELLFAMRSERNLSMVVVTHNPRLAGRADRILELREGVLISTRPEAGDSPEEGAGHAV